VVALSGSALVGAAMARSAPLGIAACVGLCFLPLVLLNLPLAIVLWLPLVSLIALPALDVGPNAAGMMIVVGWLGAFATQYSNLPTMVVEHARLLVAVAAMVLWLLVSMAWATTPSIGSDVFFGWLVAGAIMVVVSTTLVDRRYLRLAIAAFVLGVVVSVTIGLAGGAVAAPEPGVVRVVGGSGDPNVLAAGIVPAIVLALGLAGGSRRIEVRVAVLLAVAILLYGLVATQSRGGVVAAIVAAAAGLLLLKEQRGGVVVLVLSAVGFTVVSASVDPVAWQRILDFGDSTGRSELWSVAWSMWQDHPVAGVGMQGFVDNAAGYVRKLGALEYAEFLTDEPKVVHNSYLELLAEAGVVGLVLYAGVVTACLVCAWRAAARFAALRDAPMAALSRALVVAVLAMLTASFFISGGSDRRTWVLLAIGPALLGTARRQAMPAPPPSNRIPAS
jgi:hypothetical protein